MKGKIEILVISNRYKDTIEDLIDSSDIELPNLLRLVNKRLYNIILGSKNSLITKPKLGKKTLNGL